MSGLNKVILVGNISILPEIRVAESGLPICKFSMAVNKRTKDTNEVCFVPIIAFGRTGEMIAKHFHRGDSIIIEGHLNQEEWTSKEGNKNTKLNVIADNFQFTGERKEKDSELPSDFASSDIGIDKSGVSEMYLPKIRQNLPF